MIKQLMRSRVLSRTGLAALALALSLATVSPSSIQAQEPLVSSPAAAQPATQPGSDPRFGVIQAHESPEHARAAGVRWQRVYFFWNEIQPNSANDWNLNAYAARDQQLERDREVGIEIVGVIGNPPEWATRNLSVPSNLNLPTEDPANHWARFVERLAQTYAGRIDTWIIWNEPDIEPGRPYSTWAGSEDEYALLLKHAYLAIKKVNPRAKVLFAGTTYWADAHARRKLFFERVVEVIKRDPAAAANNYYFDAVPIHIYSTSSTLYDIPIRYKEAMQRLGISKPIWINETNAVPYNDPGAEMPKGGYRVTLDEQANFVIQAMTYAIAAGVERIAFYKMVDGEREFGDSFGLVRNNGTPRPAFQAFQVGVRYLSGLDNLTRQVIDGVEVFHQQRGKTRTTIFWNTTGISKTVPIRGVGTKATLINRFGEAQPVEIPTASGANYYVFNAPPATSPHPDIQGQFMVGGEPFILIEEGIGEGIELNDRVIFYPIVGRHVAHAMLDFFKSRGQIDVFGYPRTDEAVENGKTVQYFQRARVEWDPVNETIGFGKLNQELIAGRTFPGPGPEVQEQIETAIEEWRKKQAEEAQARAEAAEDDGETPSATPTPDASDPVTGTVQTSPDGEPQLPVALEVGPNRLYFHETGHTVQGEFLDFFRSRGGVATFGRPLSEEVDMGNGVWVQHFENLRIEWRENASPRISLALIGDEALRARGMLHE